MIEDYIWRRHNTVVQQISTQLRLNLCEATESTLGARVSMQWWEQAEIDLEVARETVAAEADKDKDGMDE